MDDVGTAEIGVRIVLECDDGLGMVLNYMEMGIALWACSKGEV